MTQWKKSKTQRSAASSLDHLDNINPIQSAFTCLWNSTSSVKQYDALADQHTNCYFGTAPARFRMKKLVNDLNSLHFRGRSEVIKNIQSKRANIQTAIKKYQSIENIKILPYCQDLRDNFHLNLCEFKTALKASKNHREEEHREYLKQYCMNKEPEIAKMRIVRTLQPIKYQLIGKSENTSHYLGFHMGSSKSKSRKAHEVDQLN